MRLVALALLVAGAAALGASAATTAPPDHAALALNVLPPGEGMNPPDLTSQIDLYDGLTPKQGNVTASDLTRYYKRETLGLGGAKAVRTEHPEKGVTIYRDAYDVPHIYGQSRAATEFGAGWATAEDRGLDLQLLRGPARIAALDVPGYNALSLALSGAAVRAERADGGVPRAQVQLASKTKAGRQLLADVDAYVRGINAYFKKQGGFVTPFTRNDIVALGALIGAVFGAGGGNETASAELLSGAAAAARRRAGALRVERPARAGGRGDAGDDRRPLPVRVGAERRRPRQRPDRRGELHRRDAAACSAQRDVERAPRRCVPLVVRASDLRRRPAGRLLLAGDPHGGGPARRRPRRARRRVPRPRLLPPDRSRARLRVERDLRDLRRHRPVRRDAVRRRHGALPLQGHVHADGHVRRRHAEGHAGHGARLPHDGARPGDRLRDEQRHEGRHLARALDARPRAAGGDPVPGRSRRAASTRRRSSSRR